MSSFNFTFDSSFFSFQFDIFANFSENIFLKIKFFDENLIQVFDLKSQTPTKTLKQCDSQSLFVYPLCKNDFLPPKLIFGSGQSSSKRNLKIRFFES